jgi:predicted transcriptional regulator
MSTIELKQKVLEKLESADDYLLKEILGILELENFKSDILKIPEAHKKSIDAGLAEMEAGETVSNEEVTIKVQQWLGK